MSKCKCGRNYGAVMTYVNYETGDRVRMCRNCDTNDTTEQRAMFDPPVRYPSTEPPKRRPATRGWGGEL